MKIISKFKDYYDSLASHDASTGVYERTTKELPVDWIGYGYSVLGNLESYELQTGLIGFCGKVYPYVKYTYHLKDQKSVNGFAYTYEDYKAVVDKVEGIKSNRYRWMGGMDIMKSFSGLDNAKLWFAKDFQTLQDDMPNWKVSSSGRSPDYVNIGNVYYDHKVPYYALEDSTREEWTAHGWTQCYKLTLNPKLTDYQFYRVFDAYSAFQEIEMFMNNQIIRPDDPFIEPVSDELKAQAHGFDKFSFRKDKCKPKRRKRND